MNNRQFIRLITQILKTCNHPPVKNLRDGDYEKLYPAGLTMGTLIVGKQGAGKTTTLARHLIWYLKQFPDRAIFVLDWSGSISKEILRLILQEPQEIRESLVRRIVYDELGHPQWVVPLPEFSPKYGSTLEEQVQRVSNNLQKLSDHLVQKAPVVGGAALNEVAPEIFRLLAAITNEQGESWQITEAKKLLIETGLLKIAAKLYGGKVPSAKWYIEQELLSPDVNKHERDLRTYMLRAMLGLIESRETRARVGFPHPGWTPKEAIDNHLIVIVNGQNLINQKGAQYYLFTQAYSLIMEAINKRTPGDDNDTPVGLVLDEVYPVLHIPGMAEEVGMLAPQYRSRKLELYIVIQALWQLDEQLREQIWSLGNVICFGLENFKEAYEVSQQLFHYGARTVKAPPMTDTQQPIFEPDRGQYLDETAWVQSLKHRECVVRSYFTEKQRDPFIRHISQTLPVPHLPLEESVEDFKNRLLRQKAIEVREALEVVNNRTSLNNHRGTI